MGTRMGTLRICVLALSTFTVITNTSAAQVSSLPPIGNANYMRGCLISHVYEDGTAHAFCPEDGASYYYDADGNLPPIHSAYRGPRWVPGWYPCEDMACMHVDYTRRVG